MEGIDDLKSGIRYSILDGVTPAQAKKVGCLEYPEEVGPVLGILFDQYGEPPEPLKFKKMSFVDEVLK